MKVSVPDGSRNGAKLRADIKTYLSKGIDDHQTDHLKLLGNEVSRSRSSPIYGEGYGDIKDWEDLDRLPAIGYDNLDRAFKEHGLERSLLVPADRYYHTSGYTGVSKRIYYTASDVEWMANNYALFGHLIGMRHAMTGWNIAGEEPLVSGPTLASAGKVLGLDILSTLLVQDTDLRRAVSKASKVDRFDIMAGTPLLFYIIGRMAHDPDYLRSMIERAAHNNYHLPGPLAKLVSHLMMVGIDLEDLKRNVRNVRLAITYAEPLSPYLKGLGDYYPQMKAYDVLGSTECPLIASQYRFAQEGLQLFLPGVVAEIADPRDVATSKKNGTPLKAVPWPDWRPGLKGELLISRPGECLPLIRYATGDLIEVLDPKCSTDIMLDDGPFAVISPSIKVMGRSVDTLDFEAQDESGNYLGCKIYSRHINEALQRSDNVRWWELFDVGERPSRLVFVIIPEHSVVDMEAFHKDLERRLLHECNDLLGTLRIGRDLDRLQILVAEPSAYDHIQAEIEARAKAGRSLGQLKPRHIFRYEDETEFQKILEGRMR
ncbi:MAG TPA: hypothetical protein VMW85_06190 [Methanomassiliicoccales archaeon]|nr:hypothetical protein [Methanomassiliicoccales archaeon]